MDRATVWMRQPNTLLMAWPADSNFFIFHVIPDGPERTRVRSTLSGRRAGPTAKAMFDHHCDVVNGEDIFVVEGVQKAIHARRFKEGRYMVDVKDTWRTRARRASFR